MFGTEGASMAMRVLIENAVLHGSQHPSFVQQVATVYVDGEEYRVCAPPKAKGNALEWVEHFELRCTYDTSGDVIVENNSMMNAVVEN